jgi:hypothetical protein
VVTLTGPGPDLSHLHAAVRDMARLPATERVQLVRADRWIGYAAATDALERLDTLLAWPARQRMPNLPLIGPTNNGKSMIVEKFRRAHPPVSHDDHEEIPVLVVQMPSDPSITRFYAALLTGPGAPNKSAHYQMPGLEHLVLTLMRRCGVRMLVIDELHNVFGGRGDRRREFLNLLRFLGNELRIPLVSVGTQEAYLAIRADDQLENRFAPLTLPRWEPASQACSLLASFSRQSVTISGADSGRRYSRLRRAFGKQTLLRRGW